MHVDSHAHLDSADFDPDREAVIARAQQAGLRYVLLIADLARLESVRKVTELAEQHAGFYWAAGIDPHEAASAREEHFESLSDLAAHPKFLAVGEIGLDYYYDYPRDVQKQVFLRQIDLAFELGRPIIIHCRDAWNDLRQILRARLLHGSPAGLGKPLGKPVIPSPARNLALKLEDLGDSSSPAPPRNDSLDESSRNLFEPGPAAIRGDGPGRLAGAGILHCFSGTAEDARDLVDLGFYVSFAGNLTFKKAQNLREAARSVPIDRLLSETDSPYLAPVPCRGRRNEPAWVREVTRELAGLHGVPEEEMGQRLVGNFGRLFGLGDRE